MSARLRMPAAALAALAALAARCALGVGASQQWVRDYVRTNAPAASTALFSYEVADGVAKVSARDGADEVTLSWEVRDGEALGVTNCTPAAAAAGISDGALFAWIGGGVYTNAALGEAILCTPSNFVFRGVSSAPTGGMDRVEGWFDCYGLLITNTQRAALLAAGEGAE